MIPTDFQKLNKNDSNYESKKIVDKTIASKIFFPNEKYTAIRIKIEKTLIDSNVSSKTFRKKNNL